MATWNKTALPRENGETALMQTPEIVSASRSTDIPAFYADWFFHRLSVGYSAWTNPFNGARSYVSYRDTRFIVFWSKNPRPLLPHLDTLAQRGTGCYVQFSLNDYEAEGLERGVPPLAERIDTFRRLTERLGRGGVVWRFDPLVLTDTITPDALLCKIQRIGTALHGYTEKLVFSFADIAAYRRVRTNLTRSGVAWREWDEEQMNDFAQRLAQLNRSEGWGYELATCGERIDLSRYGIAHNHCIDDALIIRRAYHDARLMRLLRAELHPMPATDLFGNAPALPPDAIVLPDAHMYATRGDNRDKGQRTFCGCMRSKDIGEYNTCAHLCEYCYANASKEAATARMLRHRDNPLAETITGD